ncbi:hypothetical protein P378_00055 [Desulforamulus profundi]|uniref:Uncharacterized protein n=1 Tax=Desulforamulus profundi TaxID=1383067 RepID=A0A2C6MBX7_9FIRM|nr:hypothetical protein [Desulforamulus profundi]PHJ39947.1 hypothetical protein P378_00055 [Desulforamulus profundi]
MKSKRKSAISLERRLETTKCIICGKSSDNGKFMCRRCAEEIRLEQDKAQAM